MVVLPVAAPYTLTHLAGDASAFSITRLERPTVVGVSMGA